jgi:hypothetical protein
VLKKIACIAAFSLIATVVVAQTREIAPRPPKLVLQITVDQLRGDLPFRYADRFSKGGFRRFLDHGVWYAAAHHDHAYLETIVGHTTLATGAWPSRHGMIANRWYDALTGKGVENIEDARYPVLPIAGETPTAKGVSPTAILTTTFSDELAITTAMMAPAADGSTAARIFSVSVKDRGAVPMAGHVGKAFWFSEQNGCFVTSTFYYNAYPKWVSDWCAGHPADAYAGTKWILLEEPRSRYLFRDFKNVYPAGSRAEENMQGLQHLGFGRTFPHQLGSGADVYRDLTLSPGGDELTAAFAKELIRQEKLGRHQVTDYLAISFSITDYVGHWFSTSSLESEDNLLRLDLTLQSLLDFVDAEIGLDNTLVVLSGDHGGAEYPEYLQSIKVNAGRIPMTSISDAAKLAVAGKFGTTDPIVSAYSQPYLYVDRKMLEKNKLNLAEVERVMADAVMAIPGIAVAVPILQLTNGGGQGDEELLARLRHNYNRERSGDVQIVQLPQWHIDGDSGPKLLQHSSVWAYDSFVPVAFLAPRVPPAMIYRSISTTDVAATLSAYLKTKFPSGNVGVPLTEVMRGRE